MTSKRVSINAIDMLVATQGWVVRGQYCLCIVVHVTCVAYEFANL